MSTDLEQEVRRGRLAGLSAMRDLLAKELGREADTGYCEECRRGSSAVPTLAARLRDVLADIEGIEEASGEEEPEEGSVTSMAAKLAERRKAAGLA